MEPCVENFKILWSRLVWGELSSRVGTDQRFGCCSVASGRGRARLEAEALVQL